MGLLGNDARRAPPTIRSCLKNNQARKWLLNAIHTYRIIFWKYYNSDTLGRPTFFNRHFYWFLWTVWFVWIVWQICCRISSIESLKEQNNYSEFIYVHLDEFAKNSTIENLNIYKNLESNLWREPINNEEKVAQLYFYINYAYQLKVFGNINQSINYYEKGYSLYKQNSINYDIIEYCLKPLANNYTRLGDVDRAEDIIKITIEVMAKILSVFNDDGFDYIGNIFKFICSHFHNRIYLTTFNQSFEIIFLFK